MPKDLTPGERFAELAKHVLQTPKSEVDKHRQDNKPKKRPTRKLPTAAK